MKNDNDNISKNKTPETPGILYSIATSILIYTTIGLVAGVLYSTLVKDLGAPPLSIINFLAIWYIWACLWVPPAITIGSMLIEKQLPNK